LRKLIAAITLCIFISTSTSISTAFAADEAPARQTPGTAESSQYEIRSYEPEAVEAEEAEEDTTAEDIATSESTKAFIAGTNIKIIEGALFVTGLVVMAVALSGGGSSGHGD
jgi:hypothetical protein